MSSMAERFCAGHGHIKSSSARGTAEPCGARGHAEPCSSGGRAEPCSSGGSRALAFALACAVLVACGGAPGSAASTTLTASEATASMKPSETVAGDSGSTRNTTMQPTAASGSSAAVSGKAGSSAVGASTGQASTAGASGQTTTPAADVAGSSGASAQPAAGSSAAGAVATAAGSGAVSQPCPPTNALKAGDNSTMLSHGGRDRHFSVYVPSSVTAMTKVPLLLDFHGNGSNGMQEESGSGWRQKADTEHFIVAYPDGVGNGWNVGNCCGEALNSMVDDVGFARAIVEDISTKACVDAQRVYATGISNGAGLAHRLACEAADVFAAIAAASADLVTDPCKPARPISELSVRGLSDTLVAYEGGNTGSTGWYSPGAKGTLELWKNIDGCSGSPSMSTEYCETYTQCMAGVEVTLCSLPGTGHILYTNSLGFSVPDIAWEMFKRQTRP